MGISKQPPKPFPITKGLPCQLKWTHSTVYLTDGVSASCHRVKGDPLEIRNGELNFHNIPAKLEARRKMLRGEWPLSISRAVLSTTTRVFPEPGQAEIKAEPYS